MSSSKPRTSPSTFSSSSKTRPARATVALFGAASDADETDTPDEAQPAEAAKPEETKEDAPADDAAAKKAAEARAELQETIEDLELQLRDKRMALVAARDAADDVGKNGMYRLAAKVEMYKRNSMSSSGASTERQKGNVIKTLIPVLEGFEDAEADLGPMQDDEGAAKMQGDFQEIYRAFLGKFERMGMEAFHAIEGEAFDELLHESAQVADEPAPDGAKKPTVKASLRPGYRLKDTGAILRPAKCVIARPADASENAAEQGGSSSESEASASS